MSNYVTAPTSLVRDRVDHHHAPECKAALGVAELRVIARGQPVPSWAREATGGACHG